MWTSTESSWNLPNLGQYSIRIEKGDVLRSAIGDDDILNSTSHGGRWNAVKGGMAPEDHGTSQTSITDEEGMAVSLTLTIYTSFGSKVLSLSTGILLNNQMLDLSTPSQSNVYGVPPSEYFHSTRKETHESRRLSAPARLTE